MLCVALQLAKRGLRVFPCLPRSKLPATPDGCKSASQDPSTIKHWWGAEPAYNVAIATGVSGIFAVDVDGLDGEAALRKLEEEFGTLPSHGRNHYAPARAAYLLSNARHAGA